MDKIELTNALRVIKDVCTETDCKVCTIKKQCDANFSNGHEPLFWNLEEIGVENE